MPYLKALMYNKTMNITTKGTIAAVDSVGISVKVSHMDRLELIDAFRRNPRLSGHGKVTLATTHVSAATKTTLDLGLWQAWAAAGGGEKSHLMS